jgi:RecB family exonuclease
VALAEQRHCGWPESGVTARREEAQWLLAQWRCRTADLVVSYPLREGEIQHRPTLLLPQAQSRWNLSGEEGEPAPPALAREQDIALPPVAAEGDAGALRGGVERLRVQRDCAFRAQAQWRLGAVPPAVLSEGITPALRGRLLHSLLQGIWTELGDQRALLALSADAQRALAERQWLHALRASADAGARWLSADLLDRERSRNLRIVHRVLELERQRQPFRVEHCERELQWQAHGAQLRLRIDRTDVLEEGSRLLLDYKSGAAGSIRLHEGELEPLQLALYVCALVAQGEQVAAAALLGLKPAELGFAGISSGAQLPRVRLKQTADWPALQQRWQVDLAGLMQRHLSGEASLAADASVCRQCHLTPLCRRTGEDAQESGDE